jgi:ABC-type uncharacterized transport system permease subunit
MKLDMRLRSLVRMVLCLLMMGMSQMRVMSARFVVAVADLIGSLAMVLSGALMMFCGVGVMFGGKFGVRHGRSPS